MSSRRDAVQIEGGPSCRWARLCEGGSGGPRWHLTHRGFEDVVTCAVAISALLGINPSTSASARICPPPYAGTERPRLPSVGFMTSFGCRSRRRSTAFIGSENGGFGSADAAARQGARVANTQGARRSRSRRGKALTRGLDKVFRRAGFECEGLDLHVLAMNPIICRGGRSAHPGQPQLHRRGSPRRTCDEPAMVAAAALPVKRGRAHSLSA